MRDAGFAVPAWPPASCRRSSVGLRTLIRNSSNSSTEESLAAHLEVHGAYNPMLAIRGLGSSPSADPVAPSKSTESQQVATWRFMVLITQLSLYL